MKRYFGEYLRFYNNSTLNYCDKKIKYFRGIIYERFIE